MDRESIERLRFDRRLQRRSDWVDESERAANAEALPDVSDKMTRGPAEEGERPTDAGSPSAGQGLAEATAAVPSAVETYSAGEPDPI